MLNALGAAVEVFRHFLIEVSEKRAGIGEGGVVLDEVETTMNTYACMLGGPEGKHLFMLVAPSSDAGEAAKAPLGKVLVTEVAVSRAGLP